MQVCHKLSSKTVIKLMTSPLSPVITSFFVFAVKFQLLTNFSIFRVIQLKFGGGINSETLISYLMSIFAKQDEFDKNNGFMSFSTNFTRALLNRNVAMVT